MEAQAKGSGVVRGTAMSIWMSSPLPICLQGQADVLGEILTSHAAG